MGSMNWCSEKWMGVKFFLLISVVLFSGCSDSDVGVLVEEGVVEDFPEGFFGDVAFWQSEDMKTSELVFLNMESGEYSAFILPFPVTNASLGGADKKIYSARIVPDGEGGAAKIFGLSLVDGEVDELAAKYPSEGLPRLSPDGKWLVFHARHKVERARLFVGVVNIETGERASFECGYDRCFDAKWVDDGRVIYIADNDKAVLLDVKSKDEVVVYRGAGKEWRITGVAPRRNGETFYVSRVRGGFRHPQGSVISEISFDDSAEVVVLETKDEILEVEDTDIENTVVLTRSVGGASQFSAFYNLDSGSQFVISGEGKFSGGASWVE